MTDVLVVAIDSTGGWRTASDAIAESLRRAGASVELARTPPPPTVRTLALTDAVQAVMARRAAVDGIARHRPRAIVYCSISAALLWPRRGAIFLDATAAENRPRRHGVWQRPVERRRLRQATLLLPWSDRSLAAATGRLAPSVVLSPPVGVSLPSGPEAGRHTVAAPADGPRDVDVVVYAGDPVKRRLDLLLDAWELARRPGETLAVCGHADVTDRPGVRDMGRMPHAEFLALLSRARVFAAAPVREDHGIAALEALAAGAKLVSTDAPGPYLAVGIAREADPRLVLPDLRAGGRDRGEVLAAGADPASARRETGGPPAARDALAAAIRTALDDPVPDYAARVGPRLRALDAAEVDRVVADDVLPRLLAS